jgi:hypothetical protein
MASDPAQIGERPHRAARIARVGRLDLRGVLASGLDEPGIAVAVNDESSGRDADLAGVNSRLSTPAGSSASRKARTSCTAPAGVSSEALRMIEHPADNAPATFRAGGPAGKFHRGTVALAGRARGMRIEFNIEGLLRRDSKARADFYNAALKGEWMTINEVRAKENLQPVPWDDRSWGQD